MAAAAGPFVLLVPGGGDRGVGEYARGLILADAIRERWPGARVEFVSNAQNPRFAHDANVHHAVDGKVSGRPDVWRLLVRRLRPDVVIFDNTGRAEHARCARAAGARVVYVSSVPQTRRRLFRWTRLQHVDQVWLVQVPLGPARRRLSALERATLAVAGGAQVRWLESLFPASDPERRKRVRERLDLDGPYALFVAGGGGVAYGGRPVPEIFLDAARRVVAPEGTRCAVVMGPLHSGAPQHASGVAVVPQLPPAELVDLLHDAVVVACAGGGVLCQAAALARACVAVATGPADQALRIDAFGMRGLLERAPLDAKALADRVGTLLADPLRAARLEVRMADLSLRSGLPDALAGLEGLL